MRPRRPRTLGVSSRDTQEGQPRSRGSGRRGTVSRRHPALALSQRGLADGTAGVGGGRGRRPGSPSLLVGSFAGFEAGPATRGPGKQTPASSSPRPGRERPSAAPGLGRRVPKPGRRTLQRRQRGPIHTDRVREREPASPSRTALLSGVDGKCGVSGDTDRGMWGVLWAPRF